MTALAPSVKGWCPGAHRPMQSGDGLVLRVRPRLARLGPEDWKAICDLAARLGNGIVEFTNRANVQIRGLQEGGLPEAWATLARLGLLDEDAALEQRRNVLITPLWQPGDRNVAFADALVSRLGDLPALPAKFGFAVDTGTERVLTEASADIRFESTETGGVIVRADGASRGVEVAESEAISMAIEMARWFADHMTDTARRMAQVLRSAPLPDAWQTATPAPTTETLQLGDDPLGQIITIPFGQITAADLRAALPRTATLRLTPWRKLLIEGARELSHPSLITDPDDPLLRVDACPGAPRCSSASVPTHALARELAPFAQGHLHVSGCEKGCARKAPSDVTLVGRAGRFDLVMGGTPMDTPLKRGLTPAELRDDLT